MSESNPPTVSRRLAFMGAATAGALAGVAALLPKQAPAPVQTAQADLPEQADGYQLTEHVKRYYATARI